MPGTQGVHAPALAADHEPSGQGCGAADAAGQNEPAGHATQSFAPELLYVPNTQVAQAEVPVVSALYAPAKHTVHTADVLLMTTGYREQVGGGGAAAAAAAAAGQFHQHIPRGHFHFAFRCVISNQFSYQILAADALTVLQTIHAA